MFKTTTDKKHQVDKEGNILLEIFTRTTRFFGVSIVRQMHSYSCDRDDKSKAGFVSTSQSSKKDS